MRSPATNAGVLIGVLIAGLLLASCSAAEIPTPPTATDPVVGTGRPTVPMGSGLATTTPPSGPTTAPTETGPAVTLFKSPSGNIGCYVDASTGARCDIDQSEFSVPPKPPSCVGAWGHGVKVDATDSGQFVCATDTTLRDGLAVLPYGQTAEAGPYLCLSEETGIRCRNSATGHGFAISRSAVELF